MQHLEAQGGAQPPIRERQLRTVAVHDFDIAAGEADRPGLGQRGVDLHGGEPGHQAAQDIGGPPRTRADLEDVVAQLEAAESTGDDPLWTASAHSSLAQYLGWSSFMPNLPCP